MKTEEEEEGRRNGGRREKLGENYEMLKMVTSVNQKTESSCAY